MNKKFNIKKLVKISAVALAMISAGGVASTVNANTNVHAESVAQRENDSDLESAKEDNIKAKHDEDYAAYHAAKSDPSILAYDLTHAQSRIKGHEQELINDLTPSQKVTVKKDMAEDDGAVDPSIHKYYNHLNKEDTNNLMGTATHSGNSNSKSASIKNVATKSVASSHHRTHLSKAMVRKIMKQIRTDRAIVRDDKKQLSSRKVRKAYRKYKKTGKKTFYVRRYMFFHKDEVKYEKKLNHLIKSIHTSKATKHYARKALKHVRKNRKHKHMKRSYKSARHHRRSHKHLAK